MSKITAAPPDTAFHLYGEIDSKSQERKGRDFFKLSSIFSQDSLTEQIAKVNLIDSQNLGHAMGDIWIRARIHNSRIQGKKICFFLLRQQSHTIQGIIAVDEQITKPMVRYASSIPLESIVNIRAVLKPSPITIKSASISNFELLIKEIWIVSKAMPQLPFQLDDASRPEVEFSDENSKFVRVGLDTKLNSRVLDLRTLTNQAIFDLKHGLCTLFREFLISEDFKEVHTPKIIGASSEGGANVFKVIYYDKEAFLGQSPQLYKQMLIAADRERVFEIAPIYRAEDSNTYRHLSEFIGVDLEMALNEHYHEAMELIWKMFIFIFANLEKKYSRELAIIRRQYPSEPFLIPEADKLVYFTFKEAVELLKQEGWRKSSKEKVDSNNDNSLDFDDMFKDDVDFDDFSSREEKKLGQIIHEKYNTDFYIVDKFPSAIRPFYTMTDAKDPRYSNSYDFFIRGEEILSGAQRNHDSDMLVDRIKSLGVSVTGLEDYINCFKLGAPPHAGGGIGLERVLMFYLALPNIRLVSAFPRDPKR